MPVDADKILRNTPTKVRNRTKACSIKVKNPGKESSHPSIGRCWEQDWHVQCLDGIRTVTLRWVGDKKPGPRGEQDLGEPHKRNKIWVSCTCPFFLFYNEYALAMVDSSDIQYSNGEPPVIRNPKMTPYVCKHGYMAITESIKTKNKFDKLREKYKKAPQMDTVKTREPKKKIIPDQEMEEISKGLGNKKESKVGSNWTRMVVSESAKKYGGEIILEDKTTLRIAFASETRARSFGQTIDSMIPQTVEIDGVNVVVYF